MTKPMTAVAALQLYEQGRLLIDDPVAKYFPKFADMQVAVLDAKKENIVDRSRPPARSRVQDLFRHTSGLIYGGRGATPVHKLYPGGSGRPPAQHDRRRIPRPAGRAPLLHQPGAVWDYGFGLDVLGLIVEQLTEQSLGRICSENVLKPLGMTDTLPHPGRQGRALRQGAAERSGHRQAAVAARVHAADEVRVRRRLPGVDRERLSALRAHAGEQGQLRDERVLGAQDRRVHAVEPSRTRRREPDRPTRDPTRADYGFGLGVAVRTTPGIARTMGSVGDFTWPGASGTNWWVDPREELAVVFMAHSPGPIRWHYRQVINALVYQAIAD